ncbi:MAG: TrmH family RNA methyltransferase [Flavobacterium sp.]|nr:MAG: TrmH family RNA methyltransferase [Flavobacterium sp.]
MRKLANDELGRKTAEEFAQSKKTPIIVILDDIRSLNNIGSVFRTCDAFLIEKIFLCGITAQPPNKEIHKTALGATDTVAWTYEKSVLDVIAKLKSDDVNIFAVEQVAGARMLNEFQPAAGLRYALIFGNEVFGVSQEAIALADGSIEIPQLGTKHSLNIAVSAGIVLWDLFSKINYR